MYAWLFDIDGVITDPAHKRVTEPRILESLAARLTSGEPIALVTGRNLGWVIDRVLTPLTVHLPDQKLLDNLFLSGEFGGSFLEFQNGEKREKIAAEIFVPQVIIDKAREAAENYSKYMSFDNSKKTMVSIEMNDQLPLAMFRSVQGDLVKRLETILKEEGREHQFVVHADTIATNIRDMRANKAFATQEVLHWLQGRRVNKYYVFGDSVSDLEMADELHAQKIAFEFIFVGPREMIKNLHLNYPITYTREQFVQGTLEALSSKILP